MNHADVFSNVKNLNIKRNDTSQHFLSYQLLKRVMDIVVSFFSLILLLPVFISFAIWVKLDSKGPVFFHQMRMTKGMMPFFALKFRSMSVSSDEYANQGITSSDKQKRITKSGRFLRKYRLDELPQLWNVLVGDMSLVGPRPQTPRYVEIYPDVYAHILSVRPGLTGLASILFHEKEEEMIRCAKENAEDVYINKILPMKFRYNLFYIRHCNLLFDLKIIWWTVTGMVKKSQLENEI